MNINTRNKLLTLSLVAGVLATGMASHAALADPDGDHYRFVRDDRGWVYDPLHQGAHDNPVFAPDIDPANDGFRFVGGERGWVYDPAYNGGDRVDSLNADIDEANDGFRFVGGERGWVYARDHSG
ncbi:MAG: hypothetical protein U5K43_09960 [Halofilum sp. (in: g-proteobacteria)]|nr:hypothetical protein [Halofilum sp. (in: g-proteobacteria)]